MEDKKDKKKQEATKKSEKAGKAKEHMAKFRLEWREKTLGYIMAAFGLVAGLAWNDAIKGAIEYCFPVTADTVYAKFLYALFFTTLLVAFSIYVVGSLEKEEKKKK